jgi:hypothetical protein
MEIRPITLFSNEYTGGLSGFSAKKDFPYASPGTPFTKRGHPRSFYFRFFAREKDNDT